MLDRERQVLRCPFCVRTRLHRHRLWIVETVRRRASPSAPRPAPVPPVRGPDRLRSNPAQLFAALERALNDPGLRQAGPRIAVHLARGERARQLAASGRRSCIDPVRRDLDFAMNDMFSSSAQ